MEFIAHDGPMDGKLLPRRAHCGEKGLLLVDKPERWCWLYDWDEDEQKFVCRGPAGMPLDDAKRWQAAGEGEFDVVAAPWGGKDGNAR
jgi:hypothetical protein